MLPEPLLSAIGTLPKARRSHDQRLLARALPELEGCLAAGARISPFALTMNAVGVIERLSWLDGGIDRSASAAIEGLHDALAASADRPGFEAGMLVFSAWAAHAIRGRPEALLFMLCQRDAPEVHLLLPYRRTTAGVRWMPAVCS